jgi:hypothetical protein
VDMARGELVERELDAIIERRSRKKDPDEESEAWQESERRYAARQREAMCQAWASYHAEQACCHRRTLDDLIAHHETHAARLCEDETTKGA